MAEALNVLHPTIFDCALYLRKLDRCRPATHDYLKLIIDTVSGVGLVPESVRPLEFNPPNNTEIVRILGKALNYLANGPSQANELAGWMTAGVATTIISAAQEASTGEHVASSSRLQLQHSLATFAGLRQTIEFYQYPE